MASALLRSLAKRGYRAAVGPPADDLVRAWPGTARDDLPRLRHLHIGDCNFRRMDFAHDTEAPPGYPLAAAEELLRHGVGVEFAYRFVVNHTAMPDPARLSERVRLSGPPDLVTIQIGASYTRWVVLGDSARMMQLRVELGRRLRRHTPLGYRVMRPVVAAFGRPTTRYAGTDDLEAFVRGIEATWPDADVVLVLPYPRCSPTARQRTIATRVEADMRELADRLGVCVLDTPRLLGRDRSLRGASGYHLNARGSEIVGQALARCVLELRDQAPPRPRSLRLALAMAAALGF